MAKRSAGILPYRIRNGTVQVLLAHPGGPFWKNRDEGEGAEIAARREFSEETGWETAQKLLPLGDLIQAGGKHLTAFAMEADFDPATAASNQFEMEWPPRSGRRQRFPEIDRVEWLDVKQARKKILKSQELLLDRLLSVLSEQGAAKEIADQALDVQFD